MSNSAESLRLNELVSSLSKNQDTLETKIEQQSDELISKDGQLRTGAAQQIKSDEKLYIRTLAMESTVDGIFIIDAQSANFPVIYSNRAFQIMTGYTTDEIIGQNYFLLYADIADVRVVEEIRRIMQQGSSFHRELLYSQKNGMKCWNLLRIDPVRDIDGVITHYVGIQSDITSLREKDIEIKEQAEEILHVTRVGKLAEFVSSLAHEISQPLTAILSYAQAAQRMLADREPEIKEIFQFIVKDGQRAAEVIRRLRALLKKSEPEMKPLDINVLVAETVMLITTDVTVRHNVLKTVLEPGLPLLHGDRIQLQQVLLNLISNSFDAMESSLPPREMSIHTSMKDPATILVAVKDVGSGILPQNMDKLFSHFFTSKPDGLGMGLSISRSIVEAHGGTLVAENNADRGATFYFTLPVLPVVAS